jgi:hypothetical protein
MTHDIKIIQHADECTLPLKDKHSLIKVIENANKVTYMKLNMPKTECILTSPWKDKYHEFEKVSVNKHCIKTLGVYIGHDKEICHNKNWTEIVDDLEKLLESWKKEH